MTKKIAKKIIRRPGRPTGDRATRETILDIAEQEFAMRGFAGTSLREIAERAEVNQALINYYFGTKQKLFGEVFKRRGLQITDRRIELLDELEAANKAPSLQDIVRAFLTPSFEMRDMGAGGMAFVRLQSRLHYEPEDLAMNLRREVYDLSTRRYVKAFMKVLPKVDPADVYWRMAFMIGSLLYMLSGLYRLEDLSEGQYKGAVASDEIIDRMTTFMVSGLEAPTGRTKKKASIRKAH
ncbi:TetR/AcrR family transcriptional regulator [Ferrovibrio xuzhouensis]|uniref:TetR/AcrR family transcriptional regulator n=1 Tax=Ferrovibrio xuzhouensis TaxID=1576914 RepID=A0ABV7VKQ9_9PROT